MKRILTPSCKQGNVDLPLLTLCQTANRLLRSIGEFARVARLLERPMKAIDNTDFANYIVWANLLSQLGNIKRSLSDVAAAGAAFEQAGRNFRAGGHLGGPDGALLNWIVPLSRFHWARQSRVNIMRNLNDLAAAVAAFEQARRIYELAGISEAPNGALLRQNLGSLGVGVMTTFSWSTFLHGGQAVSQTPRFPTSQASAN